MRIFDLHCDTAEVCAVNGLSMLENNGQLDINRGTKNELWVQTFACYIHNAYCGSAAEKRFDMIYQKIADTVAEHPDKAAFLSPGEAPKKGLCNIVVSVEGGHALGGRIENIEKMKKLNIRFFGLVWNGDNELASGAYGSEQGLTDFGKACLRELEKSNITADISHLCDKGIEDVMRLCQKPIVATHSNLRSECNHPRNLKDEYFKFLVSCKGLCGINFYPEFISGGKNAEPQDIHRHIQKMLDMGGENIIAVGSDFDGAPMPDFIKDISGLYRLYDNVVKWYGKEIADKIFYKNAAEFYCRIHKN